jgi:hypothetical protein
MNRLNSHGLATLLCFVFALVTALPAATKADALDSPAPFKRHDRHEEFKDPAKRLNPEEPSLAGKFPEPLEARAGESFTIELENRAGADIQIVDAKGNVETIGKVLSPARKVNPEGFTASGWAEPSTVCATAVNAMHIKTTHNYKTGKSTVFSLLPVEFAEFDPKDYQSYYSASASLVTDFPAGSGIFGGEWAPAVGSQVLLAADRDAPSGDFGFPGAPPRWWWKDEAKPLPADYLPKENDTLIIQVTRKRYVPEYIEFENRFGGLVWVKEMGLDPYPIAQVLKPVAGAGRFQGSAYAERGRIRANHPGVICISTSDKGEIGGFQIIPRDHSMSPEMTAARTKTQWMVVGPLWALDPSWEGLPPLFTDYLYPAFIPTDGQLPDGSEVSGAEVFLGRATVRARYSDSPKPDEYELLHETRPLTFEALKNMTHLRIYFPRM